MNPFRSVGALLSIALSIVIVGALLIVYFMVVPSLQHRLIDTRLKQLEGNATRLRADFQNTNVPGQIRHSAAARTDATRRHVETYSTNDFLVLEDYSLGEEKAPELCERSGRVARAGLEPGRARLRFPRRAAVRARSPFRLALPAP